MLDSEEHNLSTWNDDWAWLVSDEGRSTLAEVAAQTTPIDLVMLQQLHSKIGPARTRLVVQQAECRHKAGRKFANPSEMWFTEKGLEQASDEWIAGYKAERFAGCQQVADLCCGIGGDAMAICRMVPRVMALDIDPLHSKMADLNSQGRIHVCQQDVTTFDVAQVDAWHMDPDRRTVAQANRTVSLYHCSPALEVIDRLLSINANAAIKLAPATVVPDHWAAAAQLEWIGRRRECLQLVAWFGSLRHESASRWATLVDDAGKAVSFAGDPHQQVDLAESPGQFIYEPHATVLASSLPGALAAEFGLQRLIPGGGYVTGNQAVTHPLLSAFEVMECLAYREKDVRQLLKKRRIGRLEVKKRNVEIDPNQLQNACRNFGDEAATLIVYRRQKKRMAVLAKRIVAASCES